MQIYEDYGYSAREAAQSIVRHNLHGLDIDPRAAQLAYFSVMMKARQYDRLFLKRNLQPMVYSPAGYPEGLEYGSLLIVNELEPEPDLDSWQIGAGLYEDALNRWSFRYLLHQKYHVVVTNPPYLNSKNMTVSVAEYLKKNYNRTKNDLFSAFVERNLAMLQFNGYVAMITQQAWMFQSSYQATRKLVYNHTIRNLIQLGSHAFEEIGGEVVQTASFVIEKKQIPELYSNFIRLVDYPSESEKEKAFLNRQNEIVQSIKNIDSIPGEPLCYWASKQLLSSFNNGVLLGTIASPKQGIKTGDNTIFLRTWQEIEYSKTSIGHSVIEAKWFPCNKGGEFRKWYGNNEFVVDWENNGERIKHFRDPITGKQKSRPQNISYMLKHGLTYTNVSSSKLSVRYCEDGFVFDATGSMIFSKDIDELYLLGYLLSIVAEKYAEILSASMTFEVGQIAMLPIIISDNDIDRVRSLVNQNIHLSKSDWDSFETSWDFQRHPLIRGCSTVEAAFREWEAECSERFNQLKANEEELNRIFIDIYGLQDELTPEVEDKDVTVRRADLQREVRSLISYAVGCMFGRYSLDEPGLVYAGGEWDSGKYRTFQPDSDAIIPICDDEYFPDDIVGRFVEFIRVVYGAETLEANLKYIADALGGRGTPREVIRNYFLNDFYKDHCKIYQKRPIYWLFDSGKKNGFKCLIYLHRYKRDTIARIRTDYVHAQQGRYRTAIDDLERRSGTGSASDKVKVKKQLAKLNAQAEELHQYEEKIHHLADQMIRIDLDDGVKKNYAIFKDVLAKVK